jgi:hypothetical protein
MEILGLKVQQVILDTLVQWVKLALKAGWDLLVRLALKAGWDLLDLRAILDLLVTLVPRVSRETWETQEPRV